MLLFFCGDLFHVTTTFLVHVNATVMTRAIRNFEDLQPPPISALFHQLLSWFQQSVTLTRSPTFSALFHVLLLRFEQSVTLQCFPAVILRLVSQAPVYRFDGHARLANDLTAPHEPALAVLLHSNLLLGVAPVAAQ